MGARSALLPSPVHRAKEHRENLRVPHLMVDATVILQATDTHWQFANGKDQFTCGFLKMTSIDSISCCYCWKPRSDPLGHFLLPRFGHCSF